MFSFAPAENSRTAILEAAHQEIYDNGFQAVRIEAILEKNQLAKGVLYHRLFIGTVI